MDTYVIFGGLLLLVLLLAYAYTQCKLGLNGILPAKWRSSKCATVSATAAATAATAAAGGESFVGAYGRYPAMRRCIQAGGFNQCNYV